MLSRKLSSNQKKYKNLHGFIGVMSVTWLTLDPGDAAPCPALPCLYVMGGINLFTSCDKLGTQHRLRGRTGWGLPGHILVKFAEKPHCQIQISTNGGK